MASVNSRSLALTFCVVIGIIMLCNFYCASAQCGGTPIADLISQCSQFVQPSGPKVNPSPACCTAMKGADIPCLCKLVTKEVEKMVSMEKVVYVARTCGKDVPAGMQCGSFLIGGDRRSSAAAGRGGVSSLSVFRFLFLIVFVDFL
ncbi:uncharacterized protein LOC129302746 [Prosopis cineraria]|uniref:uncharacterized protein LOC129302746 n=1 Tax=Prosopis cineraria TaxID=364024 RepID=UPI002410A17C|nr:uncharacterized protein LOC129302746 [Prosopis cineraria]